MHLHALDALVFVCSCSLGLLVRKVKDGSVEDIAGRLAEKLTSPSKKNVNRDIAGIALKAVIAEIGSGHPAAPAVARVVTPKMLDGLRQQVHCCKQLDVRRDQSARFATPMMLDGQRQQVQHLDSIQVEHRRPAMRCWA